MRNIVKLTVLTKEYEAHNLYLGVRGFVVENKGEVSKVCFLNDRIYGDYAVVDVNNEHLLNEKMELSAKYFSEFEKIIENKRQQKDYLNIPKFKEYDQVKLIRNDKKYNANDVYLGDVGVVAESYMIGNDVLVDFSTVDKEGKCHGDCITVNQNDIILLN